MRPGDHALLKKNPAAPSASESWRRIAPAGGPAERKPPAKPVSSTNPYIIALNAAASPASGAPAPSGPPLPLDPAAQSLAAPVTLAEPGAPTPSTQARYQPPPSSDTKYFPQLKRF